jgi:HPt (histidine-containing phosphotransfer) domain-containing protein
MGAHLGRQMTTSPETHIGLKPIAYDELAARCLDRIDFIERVLNLFANQFAEDLEQLERVIEAEDGQAIARLAHRMKGACSNTAAHELYNHVSRIERLARENQLDDIPGCYEGIHDAWANFSHAVTELTRRVPTVIAGV